MQKYLIDIEKLYQTQFLRWLQADEEGRAAIILDWKDRTALEFQEHMLSMVNKHKQAHA